MSVGQSFVCIFLVRIHLFRKIKAFKPVQPLFLYRFVMFVGCVNFVRPQEEFMRNEIAINRDLVGNLMIYLATECKPLYHTKLIKLLYLIDEESTRRNVSPLTWLSYKAWKLGPVSQEVYYSKNASENRFAGYVRFVHKKDAVLVEPVAVFDDSEFSDLDLEVMRDVVNVYGKMSSDDLIAITHAENSLWRKTVDENGIRFCKENNTSDIDIDFSELIDHDGMKKTVFFSALEGKWLESGIL